MQHPEHRQVLEFEDFELDLRARTLRRAGKAVVITSKVFDALAVLATNHGRVVEKDELLGAIWPDTIVEEGNLHHCVSTLRRVLGEKPDERRFITTVPGRGYSFTAAVRVRPAERRAPKALWQRRWMLLVVGVALSLLVAGAWVWSRSTRQNRVARAVPLTAAPGVAEGVTFSPDGRQVALSWHPETEERSHIYVKSIGSESMRQLTSGPYAEGAPAWSPDGRLIAFRRMESSEKLSHCVVPAAGGEPRILHTGQGPMGGVQAWTSDSKQLIFSERGSGDAPPRLLYSLALETGQLRPLTALMAGKLDVSPAVSPDGKLLAFLSSQGRGWAVLVMSLKGGDSRVILGTGADHEGDGQSLAWERDGQHLIYRSTQGGLWEVALSGTRPQRLRVGGDSASLPAVSARGDLAFIESFQQIALKQIDWPGGGAPVANRVVLESTRTIFDPQWSPDGKQIAFYSNRSGSTEIWRCQADGANLKQLTSFGGPLTRNPRWSPDGQTIAFDSVSSGQGHLHIIPSQAGPDRRLTNGDFTDIVPAWSKDGAKLYFASRRTGTFQIWSMPAAGGAAMQITFLGGFFPSLSADNYLYYVRATGGKTLLRMPAGGGAEEVVLDSELGFHTWWALTPGGVFYIDRNKTLRYFDLTSRRSTEALAQFRRDELSMLSTIAASRDGRSVLCPVITRSVSDVMLVERFW